MMSWSGKPPPEQGEFVAVDYPGKGPAGHGLFATTVRYYPARDVFYTRSDCVQGHYDGWVGPFEGDPRVVLRDEAATVAPSDR
ncbi:MAG: hypothetical protein R3B72_38885 [Polyangiaceae bacterium]